MQRVSIGRAIVREPRVFLMDEPLSNLDAKLREILRAELKDLQMKLGATFLYVTHDQVEAMSMGDKVGVLNMAASSRWAPAADLQSAARHLRRHFRRLPGDESDAASVAGGRVVVVPGKLEVPVDAAGGGRALRVSGPVTLGVRSEDIVVGPNGTVVARVHGVENQGVEKVVTLRVDECLLKATVPARLLLGIDSSVRFHSNRKSCSFSTPAAASTCSTVRRPKMAKVLFKNVNVLDCSGAPAYAGQVLVEGNRIKAVAPQGSKFAAEGSLVVDGGGATLMPGLVEAHSHMTFLDTPDLESLGFVPPEEHMLRTVKNAKKMLDQGFTACNSAASAKARLDVVLRNAINAGDFPGPRTLAASPELATTAGWVTCGCCTCTARLSRSSATAPNSSARPPRDGARRRGHAEDQPVR